MIFSAGKEAHDLVRVLQDLLSEVAELFVQRLDFTLDCLVDHQHLDRTIAVFSYILFL